MIQRPARLIPPLTAFLALASAAAPVWAAPRTKAKAGPEQVSIDTQASVVGWEGRKVIGPHTGRIRLQSGDVVLEHGELKGGTFVIDMASLTDEDLKDPGYNQKLVGHLKSEDFFDVAKYPTSTFRITQVKKLPPGSEGTHEITGDLTIKGRTNPVSFPARIETRDGQAVATGKVVVDRTRWDIRYGSGKFFQGLGDKMIDDRFSLDLRIVGKAL